MGNYFTESIQTGKWEDFMVQGNKIGDVKVIKSDDHTTVGLWKHTPEEHPDGMPYGVEGTETFHVVEGKAILTTGDGEEITMKPGHVYSFSNGFEGTWRTIEPFMKFFVTTTA
ncbi:cupin domain-containing protein [Salibacterium sp. K-3]